MNSSEETKRVPLSCAVCHARELESCKDKDSCSTCSECSYDTVS